MIPFPICHWSGAPDGGGGGPTTGDCGQCAASPVQWSFSVSGVTQNTPECNLASMNGDFVLTHDGGCHWRTTGDVFSCSANGPAWELQYIPVEGKWDLASINGHRYQTPGGSWDCLASNTIPISSGSGCCANWPASITVHPV